MTMADDSSTLSITDRYVQWVQQNLGYRPNMLMADEVNRFRSPLPEAGCSFSLEERSFLYLYRGFPLMLNGPTGTGKTTLVENLAVRLGLPFYQENAKKKLTLKQALIDPHIQDENTVNHPGQMTLACIFDGLYFLEECANLDEDNFVEFHAPLQKKPLTVPTQFGAAQFFPYRLDHFNIIAAGNFSYQRPDFSIASLQRWVWVDMPYMSRTDFAASLRARQEGKGKMSDDMATMEQMEAKFKALYLDQAIPAKTIGAVSDMLAGIREKADKSVIGIHQNPDCYFRAAECYSPGLTPSDFYQIVLETVVHTILSKDLYFGRERKVQQFRDIAREQIMSNKNLFSGKQAEVTAAGGSLLGRLRRFRRGSATA